MCVNTVHTYVRGKLRDKNPPAGKPSILVAPIDGLAGCAAVPHHWSLGERVRGGGPPWRPPAGGPPPLALPGPEGRVIRPARAGTRWASLLCLASPQTAASGGALPAAMRSWRRRRAKGVYAYVCTVLVRSILRPRSKPRSRPIPLHCSRQRTPPKRWLAPPRCMPPIRVRWLAAAAAEREPRVRVRALPGGGRPPGGAGTLHRQGP